MTTKNSTNLFFVGMQAREAAEIALDTPPDPAETLDITFATYKFRASELIGQWTAAQLDGTKAKGALLDRLDDKVVTVDRARGQGFLTGMDSTPRPRRSTAMRRPLAPPRVATTRSSATSAPDGNADGGLGRDGELPEQGRGHQRGLHPQRERRGAYQALEAAGVADDALIVSGGGCAGAQSGKDAVIGATSKQHPLEMASHGVAAIADLARGSEAPRTNEGLDFYSTGVGLVTDQPVNHVESIDTTEVTQICLG